MAKSNIKTTEIAEMIGKTSQTLNHMKHKTPVQYEITVLGALCKKLGIDEDDLMYMAKTKEQLLKGTVCKE